MLNLKFGIGVVIAIVMQVSAFVWWTAQQAQTINTLKEEMAQLTAKSAVADEVNIKRDVAEIKDLLKTHAKWMDEYDKDLEDLIKFAEFTENKWASAYDEDPGYTRIFGTKPAPKAN